jgi:coenzyme F420-reducing hydrogenase beta subunit
MNHQLLSPKDIVRSGLCIGCGSCVAQANATSGQANELTEYSDARPQMDLDRYGHFKPMGSPAWLRHRSESFSRTCPFSPVARDEDDLAEALFPDAAHSDCKVGRFETAYVGYVAEEEFRTRGSSGGMVSWVLEELLRQGLVDGVAHVSAVEEPQKEGRFFRYRISHTAEEIRAGAKSRYYPVELSDVLQNIRALPGRYAVVGVPCFIKAIQLLRREDALLRERIAFTLGLFCGHMKSARMMESFAWQMGVSVEEIQRVEYRLKDPTRAASTYTAQLTLTDGREVRKDWWNLADGDWGAGFFQNSACNFCDDVVAETADISFGDAWVEPYSSDGRGTNVVVVRSRVLDKIVASAIEEGRLKLDEVDNEFIIQTQAAGFRQRREGLAYRLSWPRLGVQPRKRVAPDAKSLSSQRKLIYRLRSLLTAWSHRVFWLARRTRCPQLYIRWAWTALATYHGLAYSRGKLGQLVERLGLKTETYG